MRLRTIEFLACTALGAGLALAQVTLNGAYTTTAATSSNCAPGPRAATFLTTDTTVFMYVSVSNALSGDVLEVDWYRPDGALYTATASNPLTTSGDVCFNASIAIAGNQAAQYTGNWTVRGYWNSAALFTAGFALNAPGSTTGASCIPSAANLIGNGSFEQPGASATVATLFANNSTAASLPCWTVTGGSIDYVGSYWQASDGNYSLDMDGINPGAVAQTFATTPGTQYTVSFDLAGNPDGGSEPKKLQASAGGTSQSYTFDASHTTHSNMGWAHGQIFRFTANSALTTLQFTSLDDPSSEWGPVLDNVCVIGGANPCSSSGGGGGGSTTITIFNTGVASSGLGLAAAGTIDSHYTLYGSPDASYPGPHALVATPISTWISNASSTLSQWIGPRADSVNGNAVGNYTYRTTFDLTGFNPATAVLTGRYATDNSGVIKLNGAQVGSASSDFATWTSFSISSGFVAGINTLDFVVANAACGGCVNPTGLRVEMSGTASAGSGGGGGGTTGANLIQNPGADQGAGDPSCNTPATSVPGWTITGTGVAICQYGPAEIATTDPGPPDRGANFFSGGPSNASSSLSQHIDVSSTAASIDAGTLGFTLSGWLGGWSSQDDNATVTITFRSASSASLGTAQIGPVLAADRNNASGLIQKTKTGTVPTGTRSVDMVLLFTRASGDFDDGAADSLSLVFTTGGGGGGGGGGGNCSYYVNPLTNSLGASGGTGLVLITTATGCAWSATSNAAWITISAGASGTGSGAVSYAVAANTSTSSRTGTLTIAGQTHTVTQAGAPACTYSLGSSGDSVPAAGRTGAVLVTTGSACTWTATSNVSWININSGASGTGSGTVNYTVAANAANTARTGTLTIGGQTFTITQAAAASGSAPTISSGGLVNAASYTPPNLPSGAIAQGSFFSIFGTNLGPAQYQSQTSYPLLTSLGNVSVKIAQGSASVNAYMVFVASSQINAIMPSNAPIGNVQVTVTYQGVTSAAVAATVAASNFGIFSTAAGNGPGIIQNYVSATQLPLNTRSAPAMPGQVEILLGTGLGAISGPDNQTPPVGNLPVNVQITIGGQVASLSYSGRMPGVAGVDQINFTVPASAPTGCYVPVQVQVGSTYSNTVTMAISPQGQPCSDPQNPFGNTAASGGKLGSIFLLHADVLAQLQAGQAPTSLLLDIGLAIFVANTASGDLGFNPLLSLPPIGSCAAYAGNVDLSGLLGNPSAGGGLVGSLGRRLDAGPSISISGAAGTQLLSPLDTTAQSSPYVGVLGGSNPLSSSSLPLFLNPGTFQIKGTGGKDVGAFQTSINFASGVTWTNRAQIAQIDRSAGVTLNWSGGDASKLVVIAGASTDQTTQASAGFFCFVPSAPGSFSVPVSVLGNLPPTVGTSDSALGALMVATIPNGNYPAFTASGLDSGLVFPINLAASTVAIK